MIDDQQRPVATVSPVPAETNTCCQSDLEAKQVGQTCRGCSETAPGMNNMELAE